MNKTSNTSNLRDELLASSDEERSFPEITTEIIIHLYKTKSFTEEERGEAASLVSFKISNSQPLRERILKAFDNQVTLEEYVINLQEKIMAYQI